MFELARGGENVVITTSTASGKTLGFLLPVLQEILSDPRARAIFIYPTKALASDQYKALRPALAYFGEDRISAGIALIIQDLRRLEKQIPTAGPGGSIPFHPRETPSAYTLSQFQRIGNGCGTAQKARITVVVPAHPSETPHHISQMGAESSSVSVQFVDDHIP